MIQRWCGREFGWIWPEAWNISVWLCGTKLLSIRSEGHLNPPPTYKLLMGALAAAAAPPVLLLVCAAWVVLNKADGVAQVGPERLAFLTGLGVALPVGLLCSFVTLRTYFRYGLSQKLLLSGVILGILNILFGAVSWGWFFAVSAFVHHHG